MANLRHIATFDPPTVLRLISLLKEQEAEIGRLRGQVGVQEALCDSNYLAGLKRGWNYCVAADHAGYAASIRSREGTIAAIRAARSAFTAQREGGEG
ncbi:hypothetical protein [Phenylobacterium sp. J367]|uniref:hypothetical protein n=1 Tax=Phenylobacterium sp. J367 TaxID=2898435 RepID=UPI002150FBA7|nr:hypothetical protein [Phenylobacterium sp. J367]MCR5876975.1 hypothetical protein [Phenylobacterium sp. J367]MCR5877043.1 hypothetical protein [Phenylobacterium sp. J367]